MTNKELVIDWSLRSIAMIKTRQQEYVKTHPIRYVVERYLLLFLLVSIGGWLILMPLGWYLNIDQTIRGVIVGLVGAGIIMYRIHNQIPEPDVIVESNLTACLTMSDNDFRQLATLAMHPDEFLSGMTGNEYRFYAGVLKEIAIVLELHAARLVIDKHYEAAIADKHIATINAWTKGKDHS